MERGDSRFLFAVGLIIAGAIILGQSTIHVVALFLPWTTSLWVLLVYGIVLIISAFALHDQRSLGPRAYGYIMTVYITLMASSFYFLRETEGMAAYAALAIVYAVPALLLALAWIGGKRQHLY